jgi:flagellar M-ring protein FliF
VTNLAPSDVSIVNQEGVPLGDEEGGAFESETIKNQIRYKKEFEKEYEQKIVNVLAPVIGGIDKVVAKVTIDFDFAREDSVSEVYDPNSVPRSEQSVEEKREGKEPNEVGGVPGAVSNIGPVQGLESNQLRETYEKNSNTINYEISKKVTNVKGQFATIRRLSAAVVVDGNYDYSSDEQGNSTNKIEFIPLTAEQMRSIEQIVRQTVGFNANRGDEVTVSNFEFKPLQKDGTKAPTQSFVDKITFYTAPLIPIIKYLIAAILLFVFYKKVIEPFTTKMVEETVDSYDQKDLEEEKDDEESAEDTLEKFKKARKKVEAQLGIGEEFNEEELKYDVLLEKIKSLADDKSEEVAGLLQQMIKTEGDFNLSTDSLKDSD